MKVILKGSGPILYIENLGTGTVIEYNVITSGVYLEAAGDDITKKKGKYITSDFMHQEMKHHDFDIPACKASCSDFEFEVEFELPDEDFNPKEIHLLKSDYEFNEIPYAILTHALIYKGKEYHTKDDIIDYFMEDFTDINLVEYGKSDFKLTYDFQ